MKGLRPKDLVCDILLNEGGMDVLIKVCCQHSIWLMRNNRVFEGDMKFKEFLTKLGHLVDEFSSTGKTSTNRAVSNSPWCPPLADCLHLSFLNILAKERTG